ncbi:MAG: NAD(P)/FAD-dependent oxidoreductase [Ilumatobacteraceae bacterium]|nr:NAD(P)/FAD-dependent oxidoreductase [Ilumatobacteraceae bacterium]
MDHRTIAADYVVRGAGAAGMAFVDELIRSTEATVVVVDRHAQPGGHWNDAYPHVRLHQPSAYYGVGSEPLGADAIDADGPNAGFYELASGPEVVAYFDRVMRHRLLPSGQVTYLPMSDLDDDGTVRSMLSGARCQVEAGTFVDATWSQMRVPSTTPPPYEVADDVRCVPPNDLARLAADHESFVIVGAGKTAMDACCWLLGHGVHPDRIRWIVPRDSWTLNRANFQPGREFFPRFCRSLADMTQAAAEASTIDDLFARLEACDELRRIDRNTTPTAYHCAILSDGELELLRSITGVVRLGHVRAIRTDEIALDHGSIPTDPGTLHVDCSATGIPARPSTPIFEPGRITLQWVRTCQPTFSAAMIGHVEATVDDLETKNWLCPPIAPPDVPRDWLRMFRTSFETRGRWQQHPELESWIASTRLDPVAKLIPQLLGVDDEVTSELMRYAGHLQPALENLDRLLQEPAEIGATS